MLIPKTALAITAATSTDEMRYSLNAVQLTRTAPTTCQAAATNGTALITCTWPDANSSDYPLINGAPAATEKPDFTTLIHRDDLNAAAKTIPKKPYTPILKNLALNETAAPNSITLTTTDLSRPTVQTVKPVDGTFPDFTKVIPTAEPTFTIFLSAELVSATLATCAKILDNPKKSSMLKFEFTDNRSPVKITGSNSDGLQVLAVIMPMRGD